MNHKCTYRLYREEGLSIRSKAPKRKRTWRYRQGRSEVSGPNEVWAMDFMADQLFDGRPFRILTVVDCHTRESLTIVPRVSFRAYQVVEAHDEIARSCGRPKSLRVWTMAQNWPVERSTSGPISTGWRLTSLDLEHLRITLTSRRSTAACERGA